MRFGRLKEVVVLAHNLLDGNTKSCGCLRIDAGARKKLMARLLGSGLDYLL